MALWEWLEREERRERWLRSKYGAMTLAQCRRQIRRRRMRLEWIAQRSGIPVGRGLQADVTGVNYGHGRRAHNSGCDSDPAGVG
jgi:hypothetical protein